MAEQMTFTAYSGGEGLYRNRKTEFEAEYYKKKDMKTLYPAGGFSVCGQVGKGRKEIGELTSAGKTETVYRVSKMPHTVIKGYIKVGDDDYIAVVKDVLVLWIFLIIALIALLAAAGFLIRNAVLANAEPETTTKAYGEVDPNAVYGIPDISVPDKIDTKGREIEIVGIPSMKFKAGELEQTHILTNPEGNPCYFQIEIVLLDTNEVIYTSKLLPPGYSISKFNITRPLEAGTYSAMVKFNTFTFDKEQKRLNGGQSKTTIYVE